MVVAVVLLAHVVGVMAAVIVGRWSMRAALLAAMVAPAVTTVWAAVTLWRDADAVIAEMMWVRGLDVGFRFRTDDFALLMVMLVAGIGTAVFVYSIGYFGRGASGGSRFPATLLAFSASMLGLVLADSVWTLFIFWEFTTVTSFLLVGDKHLDPAVRTAARRALLITGAGGLALLAGLLVLADAAGTSTLTGLEPVEGAPATIAAVLIMIAAATKSAQVPFHVWLPGAMAAPTPVSAYLHSATMVKAGVLVVAVVGPALADVAAWKVLGLGFGGASMLWGAVGALRQRDAKLILAWGTISQLGLLITVLSLGTAKATFAAISLFFAHALFKSALFLVVGEVDIRTGTREVDDLGGLARSMPVSFAAAVLAGASMIGVPPLVGFMAKEAAIEAVLALSGIERAVAITTVVGGSILTVAYTIRFLLGVFGPGPTTSVSPMRWAMTLPAVVLSAAGFLAYVWAGTVNSLVVPAAAELNPGATAYGLIRWPGLKPAFILSIIIVGVGASIGLVLSRRAISLAAPRGAHAADRLIDGVLDVAPKITARVQHGSLPVYLATMGAVASLATVPFFVELNIDHIVWWDHPLQAGLALAVVVSAAAGAFVNSRLGAALSLGAVGIGITGLFVLHGAPDLALTQLLVETIIVVAFVTGLGHLAQEFPKTSQTWMRVRIAVSLGGGCAVVAALVAAASAPVAAPPIVALAAAAADEGGGNNVVNVVLTDIRALDTLGEVVVLATVAVGILALARTRTASVSS